MDGREFFRGSSRLCNPFIEHIARNDPPFGLEFGFDLIGRQRKWSVAPFDHLRCGAEQPLIKLSIV